MADESAIDRLRIGDITDPGDAAAFMDLSREVFGMDSADPVFTPRLLLAAGRNGGAAIGAWLDDEPVGFALGFCGHADDVGFYHYSQVSAVARRFQNLGVGRRLKLAQAEQARARGLRRMRWYFDPMRSRNAHFNLNVLGARVRVVLPNLFGLEQHGRDKGFASHRLVADWDLSLDARRADGDAPAEAATVRVPRDWDGYRARQGDAAARRLLQNTCSELETAFAAGLCAVALRDRDVDWSEYVMVRQ
ncbi:GNAT family N-acetyltransferase [Actinoallomurus iriomotensis]|uniref:N-acetyltransferase domain-containing protein n=1 Tax=Actinoallomurus iriomotensis TaxID=478107 RepID=A0A9W6SA29_9ACTN|nr:GNAT family N-acetyltransferase [Actinoallomurus iriomotensis]GLY91080.1 hypothetical protein Airi02_090090 [Actinoallomurus iriomotensis]